MLVKGSFFGYKCTKEVLEMNFDKMYMNGEWIKPNTEEFIEVENPATKKIIQRVPRGNQEDVNLAVKCAKEAFEFWQYTPLEERLSLVKALGDELKSRKEDLAKSIMEELGRSKDFALNTHVIPYLDNIEDYINLAREYTFEEEYPNAYIRKEPYGVVGAITPWNYPLGQVTKKIIPALITGNTLVLKPSQNTPLVTYIIAEAVDKVGFPKGVFNLLIGKGSEAGDMLSKHPDVDLVTFTGSTKAGTKVATQAIEDVKKVTLELGGKSPAIILKGADVEIALQKTLDSVYNNTGQTCSAYTRLLVPQEEKKKIEEKVVEKTKKYPFGDPESGYRVIGPVISKKQFDKVVSYIQKGIEEGATLLYGEVPEHSDKGYYINPVVFTDVKNHMTIAQEEIFGPVLCIIPYKDKEEAIKIANDVDYGLAAGVFGPEGEVKEVANKIKAGSIVTNRGQSNHNTPFGGYKHSGIGREGGRAGLEEFLQIKSIFK